MAMSQQERGMERFDLRLPTDRVAALKRLAGRLTYEGDGTTVLWTDLVRRGIDMVLAGAGELKNAPAETGEGRASELRS
jgi:hypothetical protein